MPARPPAFPHRIPTHAEVQRGRSVGDQGFSGGADGDAARRDRRRGRGGDAGQSSLDTHRRPGRAAAVSGGHLRQRAVGGRLRRRHPPDAVAPRVQELGAEHRGAARTRRGNARHPGGGRPCRAGGDAGDLASHPAASDGTGHPGPSRAACAGLAPVALDVPKPIAFSVGIAVAIPDSICLTLGLTIEPCVSRAVRAAAARILRRRQGTVEEPHSLPAQSGAQNGVPESCRRTDRCQNRDPQNRDSRR